MEKNYERRQRELTHQDSAETKRHEGFQKFRYMAPGAARRGVLLAWLLAGRAEGDDRRIFINRRWCIILKHDPDLQKLVKKGILVRQRVNSGPCFVRNKRAGSFSTYLVLSEDYRA